MFTGLISEVGAVEAFERDAAGGRVTIAAGLAAELAEGDSVAVAGCCLTATRLRPDAFSAEVMNQTLELTTLGGLETGARVNLEPALRASDRLGGHIVQGHVDGRARVADAREDGFSRRLRLTLEKGLERYVVARGSIALDGVSLTVAAVGGGPEPGLEVALIPETLSRTTLGELRPGDAVNVEVDLLARHAERLLQTFRAEDGS